MRLAERVRSSTRPFGVKACQMHTVRCGDCRLTRQSFMHQSHPLSRLLLGPNEGMRTALSLTLMVSGLYLFNTLLILIAHQVGYASPRMTPYMVATLLLGAVVFYALMRSGWSQRLPDPKLVMAQGVYCAFAVCLGFITVHMHLRGVVLAFLPAILLPCQFSLSPRRLAHLTATMILMLAFTTGWSWRADLGSAETFGDALRFSFITAILLAACWVAQRVSRTHHEMHVKSEALTNALFQVEHLASHDPLTGLINRRRMHEILSKEWQRIQRQYRPTTLVMMDLDHFKRVNDQFGHQVGDEVLRQFALLSDTYLRDADVVARWGGEEFLVLCPDTDADRAVVALHRLRDQLQRQPLLSSHPQVTISFSAGVATLRPSESIEGGIHRADIALYEAKEAGRDRFVQSP